MTSIQERYSRHFSIPLLLFVYAGGQNSEGVNMNGMIEFSERNNSDILKLFIILMGSVNNSVPA